MIEFRNFMEATAQFFYLEVPVFGYSIRMMDVFIFSVVTSIVLPVVARWIWGGGE